MMERGAMPKETVLYPIKSQWESPDGTTGGSNIRGVELAVTWLKEPSGPVVNPDGVGGWVQLHLEDYTDRNGEPAKVEVVTQVIDRGSINRLIRVLKRARDGAYGRDE